jgi:hypothetical protein
MRNKLLTLPYYRTKEEDIGGSWARHTGGSMPKSPHTDGTDSTTADATVYDAQCRPLGKSTRCKQLQPLALRLQGLILMQACCYQQGPHMLADRNLILLEPAAVPSTTQLRRCYIWSCIHYMHPRYGSRCTSSAHQSASKPIRHQPITIYLLTACGGTYSVWQHLQASAATFALGPGTENSVATLAT